MDFSKEPSVLDEPLLKALEASDRVILQELRGTDIVATRRRNAAICFLYLYMALSTVGGKR
jgi:hypothetical protein